MNETPNKPLNIPDRTIEHGLWVDNAQIHAALMGILIPNIHKGANRSNAKPSEVASAISAVSLISAKLARIAAGNMNEPDHWLDIAGYAKLHHELITKPSDDAGK
ncbi:MAG: hypothetical protein K0U41_06300 [Gammaproteobacteria bacterium]|nr:hypothetical protein [Gammaproteobacteria bacterium]